MTKHLKLILFGLLFSVSTFPQNAFYDVNTIQHIEIYFLQPNWDFQMDTAKHGAEGYIIADRVVVNDVEFLNVGVKYKGNSSYDSTYQKNPLHIELDHLISQSYQGFKDIKLSNGYADPSMIREVISYKILNNYMISPRANFAKVFINDAYIGLYTNTESIGKTFCNSNFGISGQTFIKCNPITNPSPVTKSNLRYLSADSSTYFNLYEMKSDNGWNELVELCNILTNNPEAAHLSINMDRVIWMLAFNMALANLDSYSGVFAQNHYLYKDASARFNPIVWDLNMSFGGFPFAGSGNTSMGSLSIEQMQSLTPALHATDPYWPLIRIVMNNPEYRKLFYAHLRTIINENISNDYYKQLASNLQELIDTAVLQDVNKFFTYEQFLSGMNENINFLNYQVPGIATLMDARVSYLNTNAEFTASAPSISNVELSNSSPELNSEITVRANITNAAAVFLAYRTTNYDPFTKIEMFDDGNHNDGQANDNIYGAQITLNAITTQFYIFAGNSSAVKVHPTGAEHVFLEITASIPAIQPAEVAVNEFLAKNSTGFQNEYGEYADWIELINNTSQDVNLYGFYLSDNPNNLKKWAFPQNAIIPAHGLLIIWADERPDTEGNIHCSFKLSADGEHVIISNADGLIIDQVSFGPQTADISSGRCPDGIGEWMSFNPPTLNQLNCTDGFIEKLKSYNLIIQPNPAMSQISYKLDLQVEIAETAVFNVTGQLLFSKGSDSNKINIDDVPAGMLVLRLTDRNGKFYFGKFIKL